jgi:uncharacterized lipoprotein YajG
VRIILSLLSVAVLCSGCALTSASIDIPYQPLAQAAPVQSAAAATVFITATDERTTNRDRVGVKKNGYGMEMAAITASSDIPGSVVAAFSQELSARGFKLGKGGASLKIEVVQFYNDFKIGFLSGDADSTVAFNIKITAPNGTIAFSKYYSGAGVNPNIQLAGGSEARDALIKAFQTAVASAVDDPDFIATLVKAGAASPSA